MSEAMEAGPELDGTVARAVFGHAIEWRGTRRPRAWVGQYPGVCLGFVPAYSSDIAAAMTVVERLRRDWTFSLENSEATRGRWQAIFGGWCVGEADTAEVAICRAALRASRTWSCVRQGGEGTDG